jgi:hypothetical protein
MRAGHEQVARLIMDQVLSSKEMYESHMKKVKEAGGLPEENKVSYEEMKRFVEGGQYEKTLDNTFQISREIVSATARRYGLSASQLFRC